MVSELMEEPPVDLAISVMLFITVDVTVPREAWFIPAIIF
jgi:hypothetical protein